MKKLMLAALLASSGFVVGCDKKDDAASTTKASTSGGGDSTGVTECDDYMKKMTDCMSKMPEVARGAMETGFKSAKDSWKTMAATPEGKASMKTSCKAMLDGLASNPMCK